MIKLLSAIASVSICYSIIFVCLLIVLDQFVKINPIIACVYVVLTSALSIAMALTTLNLWSRLRK
jgi:hypothetical protein